MLSKYIIVSGAREHNLKNIDVKIPIDKFSVITGLSGSGKSTLAFDTIYAEGQRRYVESLSAYARQFLGIMNKPDVDKIQGLSPAISIEQKLVSKNPRSTVGTVTEIYDYLRLLFARIGKPHCPQCGNPITAQSPDAIVKILLLEKPATRLQIFSPVVRGRKGAHENIFKNLHQKGFSRVLVDGKIHELENWENIKLEKQYKHSIEIFIDSFVLKAGVESRLTEAVETALIQSQGLVLVKIGEGKKAEERIYSQKSICINCGSSVEDLQPRMFSFNSPFGACPECHGLGNSFEIDPHLIIPDKNLSLAEGALKPYKRHGEGWRNKMLESLSEYYHFDLWSPWKKLPDNIKNIILYGNNESIPFSMESRSGGSQYSWVGTFEGIIPQLKRLYGETQSEARREEIFKYMRSSACGYCNGKRLKKESLSVLISGRNIWDLCEMSIISLYNFFCNLKLNEYEYKVSQIILREIKNRLFFLINVGLDYLTLSRTANTLAGGEAQRIRLATQIGSELRGVLYILDEPSIGLHQRDNRKLIETLKKLRDLGNTVIVVEHDAETILSSDYVIDLGPRAGRWGGKVVFQGPPDQLMKKKDSLTSQYLAGRKSIVVPKMRRKPFNFLEIIGAREHNLKNIDVRIPLGVLVCVSGVSGSGKSTLVNDILYKGLFKIYWGSLEEVGKCKAINGYGKLNNVIIVDQSPIGRTPRSNPATYIGVFTFIRELFSKVPESRARGYKAGRFSFNVAGGRCEECEGDGVKKIEMHFLPDIYIECEKCKGSRYNSETLAVKYKEKSIADVLKMTVEEALDFFSQIPSIHHKLQTLYDVGLGYIQLGQSATTLSGGEAQRVKLTSELSRKGGNVLYILDEPTTGLHFDDVKKLIDVLNRLVEKGNSIIVIEHNLEVLKVADWIIDLGPEGGEKGGRVIVEGTPEKIAKCHLWSYTGKYLKEVLNKSLSK